MSTPEKFVPKDSEQSEEKDNPTPTSGTGKRYRRREPELPDPATKRLFSEQPPTKRNAKT